MNLVESTLQQIARPQLKTDLPGPEAQSIVSREQMALFTTTKTAPIAAHKASGAVVEDVDGNLLLDFASGIGVLNVGHCHPNVVKAVQEQAATLMHFAGTDFYYDAQARLAERLQEIVPIEGAIKTFLCQSGTEANEASIKVAKAATGRNRLLAFFGAFHGRSHGSLALTASKAVQQRGFDPIGSVTHTHFPNPFRNIWGIDGYDEPDELANRAIDAIQYLFQTKVPADEVAAFFWEPVQGEGGYVVPPHNFPRMLRDLCTEHGILLVADEVQTGFGRTGKWFGSQHFDVEPDIVSLAKAMGSGLPIGATVARADLDFEKSGQHSTTFGGNLVACAASLATIDTLQQEDLVANSVRMGDVLARRLDQIKEHYTNVGDHRGLGLMRAIEFVDDKKQVDPKTRDAVFEAAWKRGLILLPCGVSGIRFIPPLNVGEEQIDGAMDVFGEAMQAVL